MTDLYCKECGNNDIFIGEAELEVEIFYDGQIKEGIIGLDMEDEAEKVKRVTPVKCSQCGSFSIIDKDKEKSKTPTPIQK